MLWSNLRISSLIVIPLLLSCCGWKGGWLKTVGPDYEKAPLPTPARWMATQGRNDLPVAHQGDPSNLKRWWDRFDDPALSRLLAAAQSVNGSVVIAKANIEQARASFIEANASGIPNLDVTAGITQTGIGITGLKGLSSLFPSAGGSGALSDKANLDLTQYKGGLQSSWEIDLFGGIARKEESSRDQLESRRASWHDARVAVAAEVANAYLGYRYCEVRMKIRAEDTASRKESARLLGIVGEAGFRSPADVALASATADEGSRALLAIESECDQGIKSLVAISGLDELQVRRLLTGDPERVAKLPTPPPFRIDAVPARALLQRPDLAAAERDMAEASANVGVERAEQFPKLTLTGNISRSLANLNINSLSAIGLGLQTWSIGPSLTLPFFDAGKRAANTRAAQVKYEASITRFREMVRLAVKEVEQNLIRLDGIEKQLPLARAAARDYQINYQSQRELYRAGLVSLIDAVAALRNDLEADLIVAGLEQERVGALIALYRSVGGSWEDPSPAPKIDAQGGTH
jgi:multidrug efflux system outer membrane protein